MPKLILFDIDGTLVLTGGAGSRGMTRAFADVFGVADAFAGITMPGRTDPLIVADAVERCGLTADLSALGCFRARYCECLVEELQHDGPRKGVLPGVRRLLDALGARPDGFPALLTGNYRAAARIKLEYFDLWRYFACGAFGEDAVDRNGLVEVAVARAAACGAPRVSAHDVLIVGDTPLDVACAHAAGACAVAVASGGCDAATLAASGAEVVFEDLTDTDAFLRLLGERGALAEAPGSRTQPPR
jgi:phosphoglycolate phosphatase-like HAD superfamily hydrolase